MAVTGQSDSKQLVTCSMLTEVLKEVESLKEPNYSRVKSHKSSVVSLTRQGYCLSVKSGRAQSLWIVLSL